MAIQTTAGQHSEFRGSQLSVVNNYRLEVKTGSLPTRYYNNISSPAIVERAVRPPVDKQIYLQYFD
jgi:hypothetical protein